MKKALKSDALQQDLDRRALDAALAEEFSEGPIPFDLPSTPDEDEEAPDGVESAAYHRHRRDTPSVHEHRVNRVKTQLRNLDIEAEVASLGKDSLYKIWHIEGVGAKKRLVVTTNSDHPFYRVVESDFVIWVKLNIIESVAEFFTEGTGATEQMLLVKSDIMKRISQMRLADMEEPEPGDGVVPDVAQ